MKLPHHPPCPARTSGFDSHSPVSPLQPLGSTQPWQPCEGTSGVRPGVPAAAGTRHGCPKEAFLSGGSPSPQTALLVQLGVDHELISLHGKHGQELCVLEERG